MGQIGVQTYQYKPSNTNFYQYVLNISSFNDVIRWETVNLLELNVWLLS